MLIYRKDIDAATDAVVYYRHHQMTVEEAARAVRRQRETVRDWPVAFGCEPGKRRRINKNPKCKRCKILLQYDPGDGTYCGECLEELDHVE